MYPSLDDVRGRERKLYGNRSHRVWCVHSYREGALYPLILAAFFARFHRACTGLYRLGKAQTLPCQNERFFKHDAAPQWTCLTPVVTRGITPSLVGRQQCKHARTAELRTKESYYAAVFLPRHRAGVDPDAC